MTKNTIPSITSRPRHSNIVFSLLGLGRIYSLLVIASVVHIAPYVSFTDTEMLGVVRPRFFDVLISHISVVSTYFDLDVFMSFSIASLADVMLNAATNFPVSHKVSRIQIQEIIAA
jgi:hypothetical protein